MLAWILYGLGIVLIIFGLVRALWRPRLYANGVIALGNVSMVGHHLMKDSLGFAAFHLALAVVALGLWLFVATRESA